jgi:ribonuclease T1
MPEVGIAQLPAEARVTLGLIGKGGPYPYERDGIVFGNFEKRLPVRERGYYREYTVPTPGVKGRGARRIIKGCAPDSDSRSVEREGARGAADSGSKRADPSSHPKRPGEIPCSAGGEMFYTDDHYNSFKRVRE